MGVGYRSILQLGDRENAIRVANEQFRSWLVEMVRDSRKSVETADWDGPGTYRLGPDSLLTVIEQGDEDLLRLLLEFVESNEHGTWTTRLYATSAPGSRRSKQVLWFESEGVRPDGSPVQPGTPRVVRKTLQAVDAYDGIVPVLSEPRTVRPDDVEELVSFIEDEDRDHLLLSRRRCLVYRRRSGLKRSDRSHGMPSAARRSSCSNRLLPTL